MAVRLLKLLIAATFFALLRAGQICRRLLRIKTPATLVIITYHPIRKTDVRRFERQMAGLRKAGQPVSLSDNLANLSEGLNIAVTFDDAYQSVFENALPVLIKCRIPAAIFVPSGYLGQKPSWIGNPLHPYAGETVMTQEQILALPEDLITIGSHTVTHINLNTADDDTIRREAIESRKMLEDLIKRKVELFAAPYAMMNEKHADLFIKAGYKRVFLNIPTYPATKTDLFILGRNSVEPTDWPVEFFLKIAGAYQWLPLAIQLKKKLTR